MAFWINIYGCQPYPRHGPLSVNQLKNDSYHQALYTKKKGFVQGQKKRVRNQLLPKGQFISEEKPLTQRGQVRRKYGDTKVSFEINKDLWSVALLHNSETNKKAKK